LGGFATAVPFFCRIILVRVVVVISHHVIPIGRGAYAKEFHQNVVLGEGHMSVGVSVKCLPHDA